MKTTARRVAASLPPSGWLLLAALFAAVLAVTLLTRTPWGPDTRIYLAWTYWYLGHPQTEAAQLAYEQLANRPGLENCPLCWPEGFQRDFFTGQYAAVVGPRVLFPLLCAPLVAVFGPAGMIVVCALCYAAAVVAMVALTSRLYGPRWALAAGAALLLPTLLVRWAAHTMTEAPALLLTVLPLLFLPLARRARRRDMVWFGALVVVGLFNRQFQIALPAGVAAVWLLVAVRDRRLRNPWASFAAVGMGAGMLTLAVQMAVTPRIFGGEELSLLSRFDSMSQHYFGVGGLAGIPYVVRRLASGDWTYNKDDILLVALVVVGAVAVGWRFRSEISALAAGMFGATAVLYVLQFSWAYFRYFAPAVPLLVLAVVALLRDLRSGVPPSRSTEAEPSPPPQPREPPAPEPGSSPRSAPAGSGPRLLGLPRYAWGLLGLLAAVVAVTVADRAWHFGEESRFQLATAYRLLGLSAGEAARRTEVDLHGEPFVDAGCGDVGCWSPGWWLGHPADPTAGYPVLSTPFVAAFGPSGMLVVPALAFLAAVVLVTVAAARRWGSGAGLAAGAALLLSDRFAELGLFAAPDALGLAAAAACLLLLPLTGSHGERGDPDVTAARSGRARWVGVAVFGAVLGAALTARAATVTLVAGVLAAWLASAVRARKVGTPWAPFAAVGVGLVAAVVLAGRLVPALRVHHLDDPGTATGLGASARVLSSDRMALAVLLVAVVALVVGRLRDPLHVFAAGGLAASAVHYASGLSAFGVRGLGAVYPVLVVVAVGALVRFLSGARWDAADPGGTAEDRAGHAVAGQERVHPTPLEPVGAGGSPAPPEAARSAGSPTLPSRGP